MARIVFAAPGIDRYHFHDRLGRELTRRGHRTELLLLDRPAATFWRAQGIPAARLDEGPADPRDAPLDELADRECARRGLPPGPRNRRRRRRIARRLARLLGPLTDWLGAIAPDLVVLHGARTAERQLVRFAARELGLRVLWLGDGLLPHTLQADDSGVDGDAAAARADPFTFRATEPDRELLRSCLGHLLAGAPPLGLPRREVRRPPLGERLADALRAAAACELPMALAALGAWRHAAAPPASPRAPHALPAEPFVATLLQDPRDERVRLDCADPPSPSSLAAATVRAARRLDPDLGVVAVLPRTGLTARQRRELSALPKVDLLPSSAAPAAAAVAVAATTINHPLAVAALLAGTPVLHAGRALYGLQSVTWQAPIERFGDLLPRAAADEGAAALRERQLTWLLGQGHLWCSATHPDFNGVLGVVQAIEARLGRARQPGPAPRYRLGPAWPLAADRG